MLKHQLKVENRCPGNLAYVSDCTVSAVNAVVIVTGIKWEDVVRSLMNQAHIRANMPTYVTCVTDMMREHGFSAEQCNLRVNDFLNLCEEKTDTKTKYIIKVDYYGYCAVVPDAETSEYVVKGIRAVNRDICDYYIDRLWKYVPGTDNRTGIQKRGFVMPGITKDHKNLNVANMNPQDHNVGDCAVRALCAVLECSWDEAIDLLAAASRYTEPVINALSNINAALIMLELERHKAIKKNNRLMTGNEFCELMTYTYHQGERIFAYVGRSHCAAVLPFVEKDGCVRYKTQDTWDSTDKKIGDYWVIPPRSTREKRKQAQAPEAILEQKEYSASDEFYHKKFGSGTVVALDTEIIEVDFITVGIKKISKIWLAKNAKEAKS